MFIVDPEDCPQFVAGDGTILRELLQPAKSDVDFRYSLAHAIVPPQSTSQPHRLRTTEVYYILSGNGLMHIDDETAEVGPGQSVYIPPHAVQWIENKTDQELAFLCIVDPAWRPEDEEVL
jgi:mannose-6-phosphate isomerase-like protein (cupin superfamily)